MTAFVRPVAQGQVLNETSAWWMGVTSHIVANALVDVPDPNVSVMRNCGVFPVEFVVRGFLTGTLSALCTLVPPVLLCCRLLPHRHQTLFLAGVRRLLLCSRHVDPGRLLGICCHAASNVHDAQPLQFASMDLVVLRLRRIARGAVTQGLRGSIVMVLPSFLKRPSSWSCPSHHRQCIGEAPITHTVKPHPAARCYVTQAAPARPSGRTTRRVSGSTAATRSLMACAKTTGWQPTC